MQYQRDYGEMVEHYSKQILYDLNCCNSNLTKINQYILLAMTLYRK
jgi:hypothetical protein